MPFQRGFALLTALAMALGALAPFVSPAPTHAAVTELFFSEYIEGSSNNKALEIYNGTGAPINLEMAGYSVQMFFNVAAKAGTTVNVSETVASNDVFVLGHASANTSALSHANQP